MPVRRVAALAKGTGPIARARRLTDGQHANAEHDNIRLQEH